MSNLFWGGPISAVMRLMKCVANWPGRIEQGLKSWGTETSGSLTR